MARRTPLPKPEPKMTPDQQFSWMMTAWRVMTELQQENEDLQERVFELENP